MGLLNHMIEENLKLALLSLTICTTFKGRLNRDYNKYWNTNHSTFSVLLVTNYKITYWIKYMNRWSLRDNIKQFSQSAIEYSSKPLSCSTNFTMNFDITINKLLPKLEAPLKLTLLLLWNKLVILTLQFCPLKSGKSKNHSSRKWNSYILIFPNHLHY